MGSDKVREEDDGDATSADRTVPLQRRLWLRHCTAAALASMLTRALAAPSAASAAPRAPVILVLGDSLSAEYGLAHGTGWVALLASRLTESHPEARVVNASISGETTAGGKSRLPALLAQHRPTHVVIELGANDALRGLPLDASKDALLDMARAAIASGAKVVIVGMQVPPNLGRDYTDRFAALFPAVAREAPAALVPFLLKGVADRPDAVTLFQADRLHPLAAAHPTILANVWAVLGPLLPPARKR